MSVRFAKVNLRCTRGLSWDDDILLVNQADSTAISLSGVTDATMIVREELNGPELARLTMDAGQLVIVGDATNGRLGIRADHEDTLQFPTNDHEQARYVYDIVLERGTANYEPATSGAITVDPVSSRVWEDAP